MIRRLVLFLIALVPATSVQALTLSQVDPSTPAENQE
jgi:hypothetical protein